MINANQANSEHILGTLREHSNITQQTLISLVERIQVPGRTIAICLMLQWNWNCIQIIIKLEVLGPSGPQLLAVSPLGLLTSYFAPSVTHTSNAHAQSLTEKTEQTNGQCNFRIKIGAHGA